jgi:F-type H+-transporting ATPase subunit a
MTAHYQRRSSSAAKAAGLLALIAVLFAFFATPAAAADAGAKPAGLEKAEAHEGKHAEHHELPNFAPVLYPGIGGKHAVVDSHGKVIEPPVYGPFTVNNSMVITWIVAIFVIIFAQRATKRIRASTEAANEVPSGAQNFWEFLVEGLYNFLGEILGPKLIKNTFWFFATIFIFILFTNWFGLIPGVGTVGWNITHPNGAHEFRPWFRGGNADLNMTAAMALTFFAYWIYLAVRENAHGKTGPTGWLAGSWGVVKHLFAPKGKEKGFMGVFLVIVFIAVGLIEVVSILFRPVSLSFRLYGNVFAGENILEAMQAVVPVLAPILPIPFYFLELLVGLVQALVFTLLTSVFTLLICEHGEEHSEEAKAHH